MSRCCTRTINLPDRAVAAVAVPLRTMPFAPSVKAELVLPVVIALAENKVIFYPDNLAMDQ